MAVPYINHKYYSTTLSAAQDATRCIDIAYSSLTPGDAYAATFTLNSNPSHGHSFNIDGVIYTFVSTSPENDTEIPIQPLVADTAAELWSALWGGPNFPLYDYSQSYFGGQIVTVIAKRTGVKYNKTLVDVSASPTLDYILLVEGVDEAYVENYKMVIDILVNSEYFSTIYVEPLFKRFYPANSLRKLVLTDLNAVLKDAVSTPDPDPAYTGINLLDSVTKEVELRIFETYDGYNGYEAGDILSSVDGTIMNSRGLDITLNDITSDSDHNDLATKFYPTSSNHPVSFFIENPSTEDLNVCFNSPYYVHFFLNDEYGISLHNYLEITLPDNSTVEVLLDSFYTSPGVYGLNFGKLAVSQGLSSGQSISIGLVYDDGTPPPGEGETYYIIEPITITLRSSCDYNCDCSNTFAFLNRYGVYETFVTGCDSKVDREIFESVAEQCIDCSDRDLLYGQKALHQGTKRISNKGYSEKRTVYVTTKNSREYLDYLKSFLYSSKVFRLSEDRTVWIPCKINTKTRTIPLSKEKIKIRIQYELFFPRQSVKR